MGSQSDPSPHPAPISTSAATNMPAESNPYVSPAPVQSSSVKNEMESVKDVLGKWGKKAADDTKKAKEIAENMWQHCNYFYLFIITLSPLLFLYYFSFILSTE
ncbi:GEM-like protein 1 [Hibiscus syriacus]|uniref:GEM-like protein 1 n=1 Tax=Hibiscus syriacus TaxID=106335 RepID=UPI0019236BAB|nr:GEM-like protein 1 [Hibiscus syriacus]